MTYGLLQNRMMENMSNTPEPFVGMDVTMCMWSDRHSTKIEKLISPKKILLENGYTITLRKNGTWRTEGQAMNSSPGFAMGIKDDYYDPHF